MTLPQLDRARLDVRKSVERPSSVVAVSLPHRLMSVLALLLLQLSTARFPDVRLELKQEHTYVLGSNLRAGKLDFAVMANPRSASGLIWQPLVEGRAPARRFGGPARSPRSGACFVHHLRMPRIDRAESDLAIPMKRPNGSRRRR
jgi:LysR substrate binding domain